MKCITILSLLGFILNLNLSYAVHASDHKDRTDQDVYYDIVTPGLLTAEDLEKSNKTLDEAIERIEKDPIHQANKLINSFFVPKNSSLVPRLKQAIVALRDLQSFLIHLEVLQTELRELRMNGYPQDPEAKEAIRDCIAKEIEGLNADYKTLSVEVAKEISLLGTLPIYYRVFAKEYLKSNRAFIETAILGIRERAYAVGKELDAESEIDLQPFTF
jgi:hypothetical protein